MKYKAGRAAAGPSSVTYRGLQLLVALPLCLALFALGLQLFGSEAHYPAHIHLHANLAREKEQYTQLPSEMGGAKSAAEAGDSVAGIAINPGKQPVPWQLSVSWKPPGVDSDGPKLAICVTTSEVLPRIKQWIAYHRLLGVGTYYIFADGPTSQPAAVAALKRIPGVQVVPHDDALKARHAKSRIWKENWLSAFFHKPCNHELFVLQSLNMEIAIHMAAKDGMDWIMHVDTDELMLPSGPSDFSLQRLLAAQPKDVDNVVFPNYESLPEHEDVQQPFFEVTLFKKNYDHVVPDLYFKNYHAVAHKNPNYFITYGNGKSAARVKRGLRSNGAHRFHNYLGKPKEVTAPEAAVLHYTYSRFQDLRSRRDRCDCAPTEKDAERCFILPFDRQAFLAASLKTDAELHQWFHERLLWEDADVVADLIKKGLLMRTHLPQVILKNLVLDDESLTVSEEEAVAGQTQPEPEQQQATNDDVAVAAAAAA